MGWTPKTLIPTGGNRSATQTGRPTGASRLTESQIERHRRLAAVANFCIGCRAYESRDRYIFPRSWITLVSIPAVVLQKGISRTARTGSETDHNHRHPYSRAWFGAVGNRSTEVKRE